MPYILGESPEDLLNPANLQQHYLYGPQWYM